MYVKKNSVGRKEGGQEKGSILLDPRRARKKRSLVQRIASNYGDEKLQEKRGKSRGKKS